MMAVMVAQGLLWTVAQTRTTSSDRSGMLYI
jgi:hypothetical protein